MSGFNFACKFQKIEDDTEIIKCRDLPELLSWTNEGETPEAWARYAVEDCLMFRMRDGEIIPEASDPKPGEYVVRLTLNEEAKILLHNEMVKENISQTDLAKMINLGLPDVTRLLNLKHKTKIETIVSVLNTMGKDLKLTLISLTSSQINDKRC